MGEHILIATENRITTITINRPDKKNALTHAMYSAMADAITHYGKSDEARALVLTGVSDMFTAGNDLQDFMIPRPTDEKEDERPVIRFLHAVRDCPKPLIAAVNGQAIGVGLTMLLHCDLVYAAQSASFSTQFVKLGLVPEFASSLLLPASVGMAVANDLFLAGRKLTAEEAHQYGLIARVFPDEELMESVQEIALNVANSSPSSLKLTKSLIRNAREKIETQMVTEGALFAQQLQSPDFAESVAALMEKRPAVY